MIYWKTLSGIGRKRMKDEKSIQNKILKYLKTVENCFVMRREAGGFTYRKGLPDIYCIYKGKHIEIEVKDPKGEQSMMQKKQQEILENAGAIYILATSLEDVQKKIWEIFAR